MERAKLTEVQRNIFFRTLKNKIKDSWNQIAIIIGISSRTLRDWRSGKYTIPQTYYLSLCNKYGITIHGAIKSLPQYWYTPIGARKGGLAYFNKYGSLGNYESRRKGGLRAIEVNKNLHNGFVLAKEIAVPEKSEFLAEFFGIMLGDGAIKDYQIVITLNAKNEEPYALFISQLIQQLFHLQPSLYREKESTISIAVASVKLVKFLTSLELPLGHKIRNGANIPTWVMENIAWKKAIVRGLFDTDGSVYIDTHTINGKQYKHICLAFTNYSLPLLENFTKILQELNFSPTTTTFHRVNLRKEHQVIKFFEDIGSHNPQTISRYKNFFRVN